MTSETTPIRFGVPARRATERWESEGATIVSDEESGSADLEKVDESTWQWDLGEQEHGRITFRDIGPDRGEAELELRRDDGRVAERAAAITHRLAESLAAEGVDRPVVAHDPHQDEPPEASTDADQPL